MSHYPISISNLLHRFQMSVWLWLILHSVHFLHPGLLPEHSVVLPVHLKTVLLPYFHYYQKNFQNHHTLRLLFHPKNLLRMPFLLTVRPAPPTTSTPSVSFSYTSSSQFFYSMVYQFPTVKNSLPLSKTLHTFKDVESLNFYLYFTVFV